MPGTEEALGACVLLPGILHQFIHQNTAQARPLAELLLAQLLLAPHGICELCSALAMQHYCGRGPGLTD